jgi:hypothetical protein
MTIPINIRMFLSKIRLDTITPNMIMENNETASYNAHAYMVMKIKHQHIKKNKTNE